MIVARTVVVVLVLVLVVMPVPVPVLVLVFAVAMVVVAVAVILLGHHLVALEQADAQQQRQRHLTLDRAQDAGIALDLLEAAFQGREPRVVNQVTLVEQQHVAVDDLGAGYLTFEQLVTEVFGVDQGDDRIQTRRVAQITAQKRHRHWQRIGQAGGFHHQVIDRFGAIQNPVDRLQQFTVDRAADAAVAELDHVITGGDHQIVVDADLAEFIDQYGGLEALLIAENVVEQRGLARPEKAGQDRDRQGRRLGIRLGGGGVHRVR